MATLELFRTLRRLVVDGGRLSVADNVALTQVETKNPSLLSRPIPGLSGPIPNLAYSIATAMDSIC